MIKTIFSLFQVQRSLWPAGNEVAGYVGVLDSFLKKFQVDKFKTFCSFKLEICSLVFGVKSFNVERRT
jgi:hypothetical protein